MESREQRQASEIDLADRDPRYWRAAGAIWLVVGAAFLALSVCYSNPWGIIIGAMLIGGGVLMFTKAFRLTRILVYLMIGIGEIGIFTTRGWREWLVSNAVPLLLVLWLVTKRLSRRSPNTN